MAALTGPGHMLRLASVVGIALLVVVLMPATASATDLFAGPAGSSAIDNDCTDSTAPCSIERAINTVAVGGDDVTLLPGAYSTATALGGSGSTSFGYNLTIHGAAGARPTLTTSGSPGIDLQFGSVLRDVVIEAVAGPTAGTGIFMNGGTVERVSVHEVRTDSIACGIGGAATIRDSVCWNSGSSGPNATALGAFAQGPDITETNTARNVTAVATNGVGLRARSVGSTNASLIFNATNVIARGGGGSADVMTDQAVAGATQKLNLDHSNYATESEVVAGDITNPGPPTNQTTAPSFIGAGTGDFRQTATSTGTLNLGTATGLLPLERDFEGQYRNQGAAPDIGADERAVAPPAPTLTGTDPASGSNDNNPKVIGTAEPLSTVMLYPNDTCAGTALGADTAEVFAAPGISATVPDNSITPFSATATNAGGTSLCSTVNVTYSEVTPPPPAPIVTTTTTTSQETGQRAAALKKCKKKPKGPKRKKCRKRAKRLPV